MRIKFMQSYRWETLGRNQGPLFEKDSIHEMTEEVAQRFLRRGVATLDIAEPAFQESSEPTEPIARRGPGRPRLSKEN